MFFTYGDKECAYLAQCDAKLGDAIQRIGHIERTVEPDLFTALVHHIIGQQISMTAQATIWRRFTDTLDTITPKNILSLPQNGLQALGISQRKAEYIQDIARKIQTGEVDIETLRNLPDEDVTAQLSALRGVGVWTAEMLLLFSLQRKNVLSYGDLGILRGLRMLYEHTKIDKQLFLHYAKRYAPYGSVASLYLWAISGGALPELHDPADEKTKGKVEEAKKGILKMKSTHSEKSSAKARSTRSKTAIPPLQSADYIFPFATLRISYTQETVYSIHIMPPAHTNMTSAHQPTFTAVDAAQPAKNSTTPHPAQSSMSSQGSVPSPLTERVAQQLCEYFAGTRQQFDFPYILCGTDFQKSVWHALSTIPYGETRSYKDIAAAIGNPKACRAVGLANNKNPLPFVIPCHRVIGANGKLVGYGGGIAIKQFLLELEAKYQEKDMAQEQTTK